MRYGSLMTTHMTYLETATPTEICLVALADARAIRVTIGTHAATQNADRLRYAMVCAKAAMAPARYRRLASAVRAIAPEVPLPR